MGYYDEALKVLDEEIRVASMNFDVRYEDALRSIRDKLPLIYKDLKKYYGREAGEVLYGYVLDAIKHAREWVRGIGKEPRYYYIPPYEILRDVYLFASKRNFRYGKNIKYISGWVSPFIVEKHVEYLKKKGLVFIKVWKGNRYVFPTKEGRKVVYEMFGSKKRKK